MALVVVFSKTQKTYSSSNTTREKINSDIRLCLYLMLRKYKGGDGLEGGLHAKYS